MKIKGYSFKCTNPFFVYFKKHYCPVCNNRLLRQKVSKIIHSDSEEAKNYDFEVADITAKGNLKFTHIEFSCPVCQQNYTVKQTKSGPMIDKNDWRLIAGPVLGKEEKLKNIPLYYIPFQPLSESWDHEHCAFCWAKFYLRQECLQEGYCTRPQNSRDADWICPECYEDFKEMFGWTLKKGAAE